MSNPGQGGAGAAPKPPPQPQPEGYVLGEKLGSGSYASVYKAWSKGAERKVVAIKCILRHSLSQNAADNLVNEIQLLRKLRHRFIVELLDFIWDKHYVYIILEYCRGGDLARLIRKKTRLPEHTCQRFLRQLAVALRFLRENGVAHLDLKPQNLLLQSSSPTSPPSLKLADFGFARLLTPEARENSLRGSPLYMAPEMLLKRNYTAAADLWSVGTLLFEGLFGAAPYQSRSFTDLLKKVSAKETVRIPSSGISPDCRSLLQGLLQADPEQRMTFEEFFAHPFVDLEHFPSDDSLQKGNELAEKAVQVESGDGDPAEALKLYCQALQYLIPVLQDEEFAHLKVSLQPQVETCMARATELQHQVNPPQDAPTSLAASQTLTEREELWQLSKSTPTLLNGLDIGLSGEQYEQEGQIESALDKWQLALATLLPALKQEPAGTRRRELLHKQVRAWLSRAESAKTLIQLQEAQVVASSAESHNSTPSCCLS